MSETAEVTYSKEVIDEMLSRGLCEVEFYKVDGSVRKLTCTRDMSIIPQDKHPSTTFKTHKTSTTIPVYDVNEDSWKSFLCENLISISHE